jgi:hypothetical protein
VRRRQVVADATRRQQASEHDPNESRFHLQKYSS